jgi:hypothetical protein
MALTFLYAIENGHNHVALKFESPTHQTSEFMVTFLTAPHVAPFTMVLEENRWRLPEEIPGEVKAIEKELLEAARKFQR